MKKQLDPAQCGAVVIVCEHCQRPMEAPALHFRICMDADRIKDLTEKLRALKTAAHALSIETYGYWDMREERNSDQMKRLGDALRTVQALIRAPIEPAAAHDRKADECPR